MNLDKFILQTREYRLFCSNLPGGRFIDHQTIPLDEFLREKSENYFVEKSLIWLVYYHRYFGSFTADSIKHWGFANDLMETKNLSINEFTDFCMSICLNDED